MPTTRREIDATLPPYQCGYIDGRWGDGGEARAWWGPVKLAEYRLGVEHGQYHKEHGEPCLDALARADTGHKERKGDHAGDHR